MEGTTEGVEVEVEVEVGEAASAGEVAQAGALEVGADEGRVGPLVVVQGAEDVVEEAPDVVRGRSISSPTTKGMMMMVRSLTMSIVCDLTRNSPQHPHLQLARHAVERSPLHQCPAKRRPHDPRPTRTRRLPRLVQRPAHRPPHPALKRPHREPLHPLHEPPHPPRALLPPRAANAPAGAPPRARPGITLVRIAGAGTTRARPRSAGSSSGRTSSRRRAFRRRGRWRL